MFLTENQHQLAEIGESEDDETHAQTGQCRTTLPDGRIQTVTHICGRSSGFQTVVEYISPLKEQIMTDAETTTTTTVTADPITMTTAEQSTTSTPNVDTTTAQSGRRRGSTSTFQPESTESTIATSSHRRLSNIKAAAASAGPEDVMRNSTRNISLMKTSRTPPNRHRLSKIKAPVETTTRSDESQEQQSAPTREVSLLKTLFTTTNAQQEQDEGATPTTKEAHHRFSPLIPL